jgi:hypothetical protein
MKGLAAWAFALLGAVAAGHAQSPPAKAERLADGFGLEKADGKSLYITACTAIYRIRTSIPGVRPGKRTP